MKQNTNVYICKSFIGTLRDAVDIAHVSKTRHTLPKVMMKDKQEKPGKVTVLTHTCGPEKTPRMHLKHSFGLSLCIYGFI